MIWSKPSRSQKRAPDYLDGQLLIAMPSMHDPQFERAVVYVCAHSSEGAMGLIINQRSKHLTVPGLMSQLDIVSNASNSSASIRIGEMAVYIGGPVETSRGFVLHTGDYNTTDSTLIVDDSVSLTATVDILRAIANGKGPDRAIVALGYSGWAPGQLEHEIRGNGWLTCSADPDIVFDGDLETKYKRALRTIGVDPTFLVGVAGHA